MTCGQKIIECCYTYDSALDISERKISKNVFFQRRPRHEARTGEGAPGRVERGAQGEARPGNSAPRSGPRLEVSRRRPKVWSKSDPSAALVQGSSYSCMCFKQQRQIKGNNGTNDTYITARKIGDIKPAVKRRITHTEKQ